MKTVSAKVTFEDFDKIKKLANQNNITISSLIKQAIFSTEIADPKPLKNLNLEVARIGNNLNQIAKYVNIKKQYNATAKSGLEEIYYDIEKILDAK